MSVTPEPVGTVPETPPVAGDGGAPAEPVVTGVTQEKYEALLARLTPLEEKAAKADQLEARINEMMSRATPGAPPANGSDDLDYARAVAEHEAELQRTAREGNEEQKRWAKHELARNDAIRQLASDNRALREQISTPEAIRDEVLKIQREAAKDGSQISGKFARELLDLRRKAAATTPPTPRPTVDAPGAITPAPVTKPAGGNITYAQFRDRWATATPAERDELRQAEKAGKVVPG